MDIVSQNVTEFHGNVRLSERVVDNVQLLPLKVLQCLDKEPYERVKVGTQAGECAEHCILGDAEISGQSPRRYHGDVPVTHLSNT